ncbi:MAG: sugar-binding transcriptional regulator [Propionibacteriaceae bacterium]
MCAMPAPRSERSHIKLLLDVARAYYEDGKDQTAIAKELGYSRSTVSRLLTEARERRIVRFTVGHPLEQAFDVEKKIRRRYGIKHAWVASYEESALPGAQVGGMVADVIQQYGNSRTMLALSNGTSVAAVVAAMPKLNWHASVVTQMIGSIGGVNQKLVDSPELCRTLATRLGGAFRSLPVPIVVANAKLAASIMREEMVLTTIELAARSDMALVGVGGIGSRGISHGILGSFLTPRDREEIRCSKAVAHICGHLIDAQGKLVQTALDDRTISMPPSRLAGVKLPILVAWGADKVPAIHAALQAGWALNLATDQSTAELLLSYRP